MDGVKHRVALGRYAADRRTLSTPCPTVYGGRQGHPASRPLMTSKTLRRGYAGFTGCRTMHVEMAG